MRRFVGTLGLVAAALTLGCEEQLIAPGDCPDFCPNGEIVLVDTVFSTVIERDSAYIGYTQAYQAARTTAANEPGVQSRPFFRVRLEYSRVKPGSDTTTVPIFTDSARLRLTIVRRDTSTKNLRLQLYALPVTVDTLSTFADLDPYFSGPIVDSVNVSDLLSRPLIVDSATVAAWGGDSIRTDSAGHVLIVRRADSALQVFLSLDTLQAPFSPADSGRLAYGIRVVADTAVSIALGKNDDGAAMEWFYHFTPPDSVTAKHDSATRSTEVESFVFDPPNPLLDSNLTVGGAPSARSLIRVNMPEALRDSIDVVRATLILVPSAPVSGIASDSFQVAARQVTADLGAKSPLSTDAPAGIVVIHPGVTDTVRLEITDMVRGWVIADTLATPAFMLQQAPEAASFNEARFYSSLTPAFRPALHVTFVRRFPFGRP